MRAHYLALVVMSLIALAGCGSEDKLMMPDVTGSQLDVAKSDIERAGIEEDVEVLGGGLLGVLVESNWEVCEQSPAPNDTPTQAPRLTVDRSCEPEPEPEPEPSEEPSDDSEPEESQPAETDYTYEGPEYDIVAADAGMTAADLTQYWVYTEDVDPSSAGYKKQVKLIISDVARQQETAELIVEVVTDREIALAEAASTSEDFIDEHGVDYALKTIPKKEKRHYVASYTGGYDRDLSEASSADSAFEVIWMIASNNPQIEKWRPDIAG